jgi:hypothetical protein
MKKKPIFILILGILLFSQLISAQTWEKTKRLTWTSGWSEYPVITIGSSSQIHVVFQDGTPGNYEIYYKKSTNGGTAWISKRLSWNSGFSLWPSIAIDSNSHPHITWTDVTSGNYEIYYKKSTNGGTTWITKRLTWNSDDSWTPTIAVGSNIHLGVVWHDFSPGNSEIYYKRSTNGGSTWTTRRLTYSADNSLNPNIAVDSDNNIHVAYYDLTTGKYQIFYKRSTDGGVNWTTKRLTYNDGDSWKPAIAVDSDNHVHITWSDYTPGNGEIYYKKSTDGGATWTTRRLTYSDHYSLNPTIAVDSNNYIHIAWEEMIPVNREIYYKRSTDRGGSWTTSRLTWTSGQSMEPSITVDSINNIHVVWHDDTPGNREIYYKKGIQ